MRRRSRVDLYLSRHLAEEMLVVLRPILVLARPRRVVDPLRVVAEPLAGGCKLCRLPRAGR